MSTTLTATKSEFEVYPVGEYLAQVVDFEETEGNFGPQFRFRFEFLKPKAYAGKQISAWCSKKLAGGSKKSKLWTWVEAAYNRPLTEGEEVDIDLLIGRQVVLVVVTEPKSDGDGEFNKITSVRAYKQQEPFPAWKPGKPAGKPADDDSFEVGTPDEDETDPFEDE